MKFVSRAFSLVRGAGGLRFAAGFRFAAGLRAAGLRAADGFFFALAAGLRAEAFGAVR